MTDWQEAEPVVYAVCDELDVTPLALLSSDRHAPLPEARQLIAWFLAKGWFDWPAVRIAEVLGKNVSTVLYYLRNVDRRRRNEWGMLERCSKILTVVAATPNGRGSQ